MNTLNMSFLTLEGKRKNLRLNKVRTDLTEGEVQAFMDLLVEKNVLFSAHEELVEPLNATITRAEALI